MLPPPLQLLPAPPPLIGVFACVRALCVCDAMISTSYSCGYCGTLRLLSGSQLFSILLLSVCTVFTVGCVLMFCLLAAGLTSTRETLKLSQTPYTRMPLPPNRPRTHTLVRVPLDRQPASPTFHQLLRILPPPLLHTRFLLPRAPPPALTLSFRECSYPLVVEHTRYYVVMPAFALCTV